MLSEKHMCNLLRCKTEEEAAAEVAFYFGRVYWTKEKYKEHEKEIMKNGIEI